jgi:hypothetical protein
MAQAPKEFSVVGKPIPRIDAYERVTGKAQYTGDLQLSGMLYARVLRSKLPHAKIVGIDTSKAEKLPGVKAVIHHGNALVPWSSGGLTHKRFIFNNPVRYVGDPVAAVAATDRHIAEDALALIEVKYESIPHVLDAKEALKPDAPKITPEGNLSVGKGAFSAPITENWGDVEKGFAEADRVFEDTYITKHVNNAQLERRVSVAKWDADKLTVFASTQGVANARTDIAKDFNLPLLDEPVSPIMGQYSKPHTKVWAAKIGSFDGYVFVTPEYNHGISGALKNAIDFLFREWNDKAAGFVSYGGAGGARAVEQLRLRRVVVVRLGTAEPRAADHNAGPLFQSLPMAIAARPRLSVSASRGRFCRSC